MKKADIKKWIKIKNRATPLEHGAVRSEGQKTIKCGTEMHGNKWMARLLKKTSLRPTTPGARSVARYV